MTSLIDATSIQNYGVMVLRNRREFRIKHPKLKQSRIVGLYETSLYLGDRTLRQSETHTADKFALLPASCRADYHEASAPSASPPRRPGLKRGATLGRFALSDSVQNEDESFKKEEKPAPASTLSDTIVLPNTTSNKRTGFTKQVSQASRSRECGGA